MSVRCGKKRKLVVDHEAEKSLYGSFVSAANAVSTLYSQAVQQQRRASAQASRQALVRTLLDTRIRRGTATGAWEGVAASAPARGLPAFINGWHAQMILLATENGIGHRVALARLQTDFKFGNLAWPLQERVVTFLLSQNPGSEVVSKAVMLQFLQSEYEVGRDKGFGGPVTAALHTAARGRIVSRGCIPATVPCFEHLMTDTSRACLPQSIEGGEHLPHVFPAPQISLAGTGAPGLGGASAMMVSYLGLPGVAGHANALIEVDLLYRLPYALPCVNVQYYLLPMFR